MKVFLPGIIISIALLSSTLVLAQQRQGFSYQQVMQLPQQLPVKQVPYGSGPEQTLHIWPGQPQQPALFFIHGGCWLSEYDVQHSYPLSAALNRQGYTLYSAEYRRSGESGGGWPKTFTDVRNAFRHFIRQHQANSEAPVIVVGHSAGGHLALLLAADEEFKADIDAVVGLAAITDIKVYAGGQNSCEKVTQDFMGATPEAAPELYTAANPAEQNNHPNITLLQGAADNIVSPDYASAISPARVRLIDAAGHFDLIHPKSDAFSELLSILRDVVYDHPQ
ncbi:alpha/beta hydrolase [Idiomarina seosinensis]|uniref:alpha/beta fold hydrolase n=1 Tax=Idiomarina seosinensis TaxID=281739 RepID=UPI00384EEF53